MVRKTTGILLFGAFIAVTSSVVAQPPSSDQRPNNAPEEWLVKGLAERKLTWPLVISLGEWSRSRSHEAAAECQRLALNASQMNDPTLDALATSARALDIIGRPREAISVLEQLLARYPDDRAPGVLNFRVRNTIGFWRGRLAFDLGDFAEAEKAFREARAAVESSAAGDLIRFWSAFYEMQASSRLGKSGSNKAPTNEAKFRAEYLTPALHDYNYAETVLNYGINWLVREGFLEGSSGEIHRIAPPDLNMDLQAHLFFQLCLLGIWHKSPDFIFDKWKGDQHFEQSYNVYDAYLEKTTDKLTRALILNLQASTIIDWAQSDVMSVWGQKAPDLNLAIGAYNELIIKAPFFAPWAEMGLAKCLALRGRKDDAVAALDKVSAKWPSYAQVVAQTKHDLPKMQLKRCDSATQQVTSPTAPNAQNAASESVLPSETPGKAPTREPETTNVFVACSSIAATLLLSVVLYFVIMVRRKPGPTEEP